MSALMPLRPGDPAELAGYRLRGRLGEGGQGAVYLAEGPDGALVAIKLLHARKLGDAQARTRFAREVSAARRVGEFCTARVLAADVEGDLPYLVSEYIDGISLQDAVARDGPMAGPDLERLAIGTATALAAIHRAGIVHRDFKPANVLLSARGPRVVDFGIARALDTTSTLTSQAIGTPAYMAPEQLRGEAVGPAADVFAWACTLVYAATGTPPFGNDSVPAVVKRISRDAPSLGGLTGTPAKTALWCLAKDPAQRPTAEELLMVLLGRTVPEAPEVTLAAGSEAAAALRTRPRPVPPPSPAPPAGAGATGRGVSRRQVLAGAGALAATGAAGGAVWATGVLGERRTLWRHRLTNVKVSDVVLAGGTLFVQDLDGGRLFALDAANGRQRWVWHWQALYLAAAGAVLYVADSENLYAVDAATGRRRWTVPTDSPTQITVAGGVIVSALPTERSMDLRAVNAADGRTLWTRSIAFSRIGLVPGQNSLSVTPGVTVLANSTTVYALSTANGAELWRFPAKGNRDAALLAAGDTVYVGNGEASGPGRFWALDATTGAARWTWSAGQSADPVAADSRAVYVDASPGGLYALDARTGARRWEYAPAFGVFGSPGDTVYTTTDDEHDLRALDAKTGKVRWRQSMTKKDYDDLVFCGVSAAAVFVRFGSREIRALRAH